MYSEMYHTPVRPENTKKIFLDNKKRHVVIVLSQTALSDVHFFTHEDRYGRPPREIFGPLDVNKLK